jgi:hypothetical protein
VVVQKNAFLTLLLLMIGRKCWCSQNTRCLYMKSTKLSYGTSWAYLFVGFYIYIYSSQYLNVGWTWLLYCELYCGTKWPWPIFWYRNLLYNLWEARETLFKIQEPECINESKAISGWNHQWGLQWWMSYFNQLLICAMFEVANLGGEEKKAVAELLC